MFSYKHKNKLFSLNLQIYYLKCTKYFNRLIYIKLLVGKAIFIEYLYSRH